MTNRLYIIFFLPISSILNRSHEIIRTLSFPLVFMWLWAFLCIPHLNSHKNKYTTVRSKALRNAFAHVPICFIFTHQFEVFALTATFACGMSSGHSACNCSVPFRYHAIACCRGLSTLCCKFCKNCKSYYS